MVKKMEDKELHENKKLAKKMRHLVGEAINDYQMIQPGDRVMVCLSGGKDSYAMLDVLLNLQKSAPVHFELIAVNLDQKQPGFPEEVLPNYLSKLGVPFRIVQKDTYSIVKEKISAGKTTCSLCSRLRRGILYKTATELGCSKIALGHHRDDIMETLFLNMFFNSKMKAMPPKLRSDDGKHIVIRPLAYCKEKDLARYAQIKDFPIIPCNLCGSQPNLQRNAVKEMLQSWEKKFPGRLESIFGSIGNIAPSHLMDRDLYDFEKLKKNVNELEVTDGLEFSSPVRSVNFLENKEKVANLV